MHLLFSQWDGKTAVAPESVPQLMLEAIMCRLGLFSNTDWRGATDDLHSLPDRASGEIEHLTSCNDEAWIKASLHWSLVLHGTDLTCGMDGKRMKPPSWIAARARMVYQPTVAVDRLELMWNYAMYLKMHSLRAHFFVQWGILDSVPRTELMKQQSLQVQIQRASSSVSNSNQGTKSSDGPLTNPHETEQPGIVPVAANYAHNAGLPTDLLSSADSQSGKTVSDPPLSTATLLSIYDGPVHNNSIMGDANPINFAGNGPSNHSAPPTSHITTTFQNLRTQHAHPIQHTMPASTANAQCVDILNGFETILEETLNVMVMNDLKLFHVC
jgi:hypothetical protein